MASKQTKAELLGKCAELGIEVPKKATIADISELIAAADGEKAPEGTEMTVDCGKFPALNVRMAPSVCAPVISELQNGEKTLVLGIEDGWARLKRGYCKAQYLV